MTVDRQLNFFQISDLLADEGDACVFSSENTHALLSALDLEKNCGDYSLWSEKNCSRAKNLIEDEKLSSCVEV